MSQIRCYCCSGRTLAECCGPLLNQQQLANSPVQVMRSRFSAYASGNYEYVWETYAAERRLDLSPTELADEAESILWFALQIPDSSAHLSPSQVEFCAYYYLDHHICIMHETSNFVQEDGQWRYLDGILHVDCGRIKIGRNEACPCMSGKKFKQCCAKKLAIR